jgi:hypothetical protein
MRYIVTLISSDNNILEFNSSADSADEAERNAFKHIDEIGWDSFGYTINNIKEENDEI